MGDLNADGLLDLAVACNDFGATLTVLEGLGSGQFGNRQDFVLGSNASSVAIGDVTRDGRVDVLLAAYSSSQVQVLPRLAGGGFGAPFALSIPYPLGVAVGDIARDGAPDVIATGGGALSVFVSTPGGGFTTRVVHAGGSGPLTLAAFGLLATPNPAHGPCTIRYMLPRAARVRLRLLDVAGRELDRLDEGERPVGERIVRWDPRGLPAGIGFLELRVDAARAVRRVVLLL